VSVFGPDDLTFEEVPGLVVEVFAGFFSEAAPLIRVIEDGLRDDGFAVFDRDVVGDAELFLVAFFALFDLARGNGFFFCFGVVVAGL
jgi:hypothetical protein